MANWTARSRQYFAGLHFLSAIEFANLASEIERSGDRKHQAAHQALVIGAITMSTSFLEAALMNSSPM
jgi:hypothetical protein